MQYRGLNCEFNIEWHSISSGGKPTFPTCEFPSLEWYPRVIPFFHSFGSGWVLRLLTHASQTHPLPRGGTDLMGPRPEWLRCLGPCHPEEAASRYSIQMS